MANPITKRVAKAIIDDEFTNSAIDTLKQEDENGHLFSMTFKGDYDFFQKRFIKRLFRDFACSAFAAKNENGQVILARNFDIPHLTKNDELTGFNIACKWYPNGTYKSLFMSDVFNINDLNENFIEEVLKDREMLKYLFIAPVLCMDGVNEKGLSASILFLDIKDGESYCNMNDLGKKRANIVELLREILDKASNLKEAIKIAKKINMVAVQSEDYHLFVLDKEGNSAVFEWRYNKFTITYTNVVTNFYVGYEDAEDIYYDGILKEKLITTQSKHHNYLYGYGHGFDRFNTIVNSIDDKYIDGFPVVSEKEAMKILESVSQEYCGNDVTSYTQYSVIYNLEKLNAQVCIDRNYDKIYKYQL